MKSVGAISNWEVEAWCETLPPVPKISPLNFLQLYWAVNCEQFRAAAKTSWTSPQNSSSSESHKILCTEKFQISLQTWTSFTSLLINFGSFRPARVQRTWTFIWILCWQISGDFSKKIFANISKEIFGDRYLVIFKKYLDHNTAPKGALEMKRQQRSSVRYLDFDLFLDLVKCSERNYTNSKVYHIWDIVSWWEREGAILIPLGKF